MYHLLLALHNLLEVRQRFIEGHWAKLGVVALARTAPCGTRVAHGGAVC
jgi:hypothetical protein